MAKTLDATPDTDNARVALELVWDGSAPTISRYDPDGIWRPVTRADPAFRTGGAWTGNDYEAPADQAVTYAVRDATGGTLMGPKVTLPSGDTSWLKHLTNPYLSRRLHITAPPDLTRPVEQGVFTVLGRTAPVAVTTQRSSARGRLELTTSTTVERRGLEKLLDDGSTLLLATPPQYGLGTLWVAPGELEEKRVSDAAVEQTRLWTLPFVIVDRPR